MHTKTNADTHTHTQKKYTHTNPKSSKRWYMSELRESTVCFHLHIKTKHQLQALLSSHDQCDLNRVYKYICCLVGTDFLTLPTKYVQLICIGWCCMNVKTGYLSSQHVCLSINFGAPGRDPYRNGLRVLSSLSTRSMPRILVPELEMRDTRMSITEIITSMPSRMFQLLLK